MKIEIIDDKEYIEGLFPDLISTGIFTFAFSGDDAFYEWFKDIARVLNSHSTEYDYTVTKWADEYLPTVEKVAVIKVSISSDKYYFIIKKKKSQYTIENKKGTWL